MVRQCVRARWAGGDQAVLRTQSGTVGRPTSDPGYASPRGDGDYAKAGATLHNNPLRARVRQPTRHFPASWESARGGPSPADESSGPGTSITWTDANGGDRAGRQVRLARTLGPARFG